MQNLSAHDAKARFGQLLEAAQRGPVTISKHGREVAVMLSKEQFDELQAARLEQLKSEVRKGLDDLRSNRYDEVDAAELPGLGDAIKKAARKPRGR